MERRPFDPAGRHAVITGAGSGIGLALARALVDLGGSVLMADVNGDAADAAAEALRGTGGRAVSMACDVTDAAQIEALADRAWSEFGRVDLVANNAGITVKRRKVIYADVDDARRVLEVNYFGVLLGSSIFGRRFVEQGAPAHVLNTCSENGLGAPVMGLGPYTASKHAVLGLSDVMRQELPEHVGISVLCPGAVATGMTSLPRDGDELEFGMAPEQIADITIQGLREGHFIIPTHPPMREFVDERYEATLEAFESLSPRFDGDERLDTRHIIRVMTERMRGG